MSKTETARVLADFRKQLKRCADERDKLRRLHREVSDVLESWDRGIGACNDGLRDIECGIDELSELV